MRRQACAFSWRRVDRPTEFPEKPGPCLEPISLHRPQRHAEGPGGLLFSVAAEKAAFDHIGKPRHLLGQTFHGFVECEHPLVGIDRQIRDIRQGEVLAAAPALFGKSRLRVIDDGVTHRQRRSAQEMGFVDEAARLSEAQIGFVNECRGLQRLPGSEARPGPVGDAPQLLVEGGQQFGGDAPNLRKGRACLQSSQCVVRQWVFFFGHPGILGKSSPPRAEILSGGAGEAGASL